MRKSISNTSEFLAKITPKHVVSYATISFNLYEEIMYNSVELSPTSDRGDIEDFNGVIEDFLRDASETGIPIEVISSKSDTCVVLTLKNCLVYFALAGGAAEEIFG